jgi:PhnB protein
MTTRLHPYLSFRDTARQAMEFYQSVFGGKLDISTFEQYHVSQDLAEKNKVMHSTLETESGLAFMAADTPNAMEHTPGKSISMSLSGDDDAQLRGYWEKLSAGATIKVPLAKSPWGDTFGMLTDQFGIDWMVNIAGPKA